MKFLTLFSAAAAAVAASESGKRATGGYDAILKDLADIQNGTEELTSVINSYEGPTQAALILVATNDLEDILKRGIEDVEASQPLNADQAVQLVTPVSALAMAVSDSINATIAKKPLFLEVGLGLEVKIQLEDIGGYSTRFSDGLTALVPESLKETAETLAKPITEDLQRGQDAFANTTGEPSAATSLMGAAPSVFQILSLFTAAGFAVLAL